jgi:hypothetical protein
MLYHIDIRPVHFCSVPDPVPKKLNSISQSEFFKNGSQLRTIVPFLVPFFVPANKKNACVRIVRAKHMVFIDIIYVGPRFHASAGH